jgi:methionyl-tRNA formyltransferase
MAGERETGVTIMRVVKALDAGPMLAKVGRSIGADETSDEVEGDLARLGAELLVATLDRLADGDVPETPQDDEAATYAHRLSKEDGLIDWSLPADHIHNLIRGLHPWPHAYTFLQERRLILLRSKASDEPASSAGGTVITAHGDHLRVAAGNGVVDILEMQAEGKRPMAPRDFLAGHRLTPGDRFAHRP